MSIKIDNGLSRSAADSRYLKLDQTIPQTIINDAPTFDAGLIVSAVTSLPTPAIAGKLVRIDTDKRIYFGLES